MNRLKGITVTLYERTDSGTVDGFGRAVMTETPVTVKNVLVGQPTAEEYTDTLNLTGKRTAYLLAIPKGDEHTWLDCRLSLFGEDYRVFGPIKRGIEALVPTPWHYIVQAERIE